MRRLIVVAAVLTATIGVPAPSVGGPAFPDEISVPTGSYPEGIAIGRGHQAYVGSLLDGAIYAFDLRSGVGALLHEGETGRLTVGMEVDERSGLLWAAGAEGWDSGPPMGRLFAFNTSTGGEVAAIEIPGFFLNDLTVTRTAVYVTDSLNDVFWRVPLDRRGHAAGPASAIALSGDFTFVDEGDLPVNLNGLVATPSGRTLISVHSTLGVLYTIDPTTGDATEIELSAVGDLDPSVPSGDGLVLVDDTLYVVQNFLNQVAVVELADDLSSGIVVDVITSDSFQVPATAAAFGSSLYAINAKFDEAFPPLFGAEPQQLTYHVTRVDR